MRPEQQDYGPSASRPGVHSHAQGKLDTSRQQQTGRPSESLYSSLQGPPQHGRGQMDMAASSSRPYQQGGYGDGWDDRANRQTASRAGRSNPASMRPGSRADNLRSSTTAAMGSFGNNTGYRDGGKPDRTRAQAQPTTPGTDMHRGQMSGSTVGRGGGPQGRGAGPPPPELGLLLPKDTIIAAQDDAAVFFKSMNHVLASNTGGECTSPTARPPPAGMRGALSWGVGPNAYENDGRPGTRGGGNNFDLEGRPTTRSGMRPSSRMQVGGQIGAVRPSTGLTGPGSPGLSPPLSYAAAASGNNSAAMHHSIDTSPNNSGNLRPMPLMSQSMSPSAYQRRPNTQGSPNDTWPPEMPPPSRGGRVPLQSLPTRPSASSSQGPPGRGGGRGQGPGQPNGMMTRSSVTSMFKVEEEGDVDAFLAALSDEEVDTTNMDDLKSYLKTLDQDRTSINGIRPQASVERPKSKSHAGAKEVVSQEEQQRRQRHQKAKKAAQHILDVLIEQAVKTSEVNALIAAAEAKAMAEEAELGVVLSEHGWKDQVRSQVSAPTDDFGGLMSAISAAGSKMPSGSLTAHQPASEMPLIPIQPADDFRFLSGASSHSQGHTRPTASLMPMQPKGSTLPSMNAVSSGMARYSRIPT